MSIGDMFKINAVTLAMLILINLGLFTLGNTPWMVLGLLCLAGALFLAYRQGMAFGHEAASLRKTVDRAMDPQSPTHGHPAHQ